MVPINAGTMFAYFDSGLCAEGPMPRTNNRIEGAVNVQLRDMMRIHCGMSEVRRIKAIFWRCCMHMEYPAGASAIPATVLTDDDIDLCSTRPTPRTPRKLTA